MKPAFRLDPFAGLKRRWTTEAEEALRADALNALLQACARTKYKVGDIVLLEGRAEV